MQIKPFVKWVGGKRQLLPQIMNRVPEKYNTYFEPFLGGGAVFFNVQPKKAVINDYNKNLINCYQVIKDNPKTLIDAVNELDTITSNRDYYNNIRSRYNDSMDVLDISNAAMFIWLNKHSFNGVYRVNSKGKYNVPYNSKDTNNSSVSEENIYNISQYLNDNDITIMYGDYNNALRETKAGDFVYIDPPYVPVSMTANFTTYTKGGFSFEKHKEVADTCSTLSNSGIKVLASNNNVELIHELYSGFNIEAVSARRSINRDGDSRVGKEVLIRNY